MRKNRVIKTIIALTLTVAMVLCSSVFVSAYYSIYSCESSDWTIDTDGMYSASYPLHSDFNQLDDSVFQYEDLYEQTYYMARTWTESNEFTTITEMEVTFPEYPDPGNDSAFGASGHNEIVVEIGETYYLIFAMAFEFVYVTNSSSDTSFDIVFYTSPYTGEVMVYELAYPYTEYRFINYIDYYGYDDTVSFSDVAGINTSGMSILCSDVDIYNYDYKTVYYEANEFTMSGATVTHYFDEPLIVMQGSLSCSIDADILEKMSNRVVALVLDKFGFVIGSDTDFLDLRYSLSAVIGDFSDTIDFCHYNYNSTDDNQLLVSTKVIDSEFVILDYFGQELDVNDEAELIFKFSFASTGYNLFFPGSIELVEYASYEESQQHKEVIDKLDDVNDSIQSGFDTILNNKIGLEEVVIDTSKIDDFVAEQDEVLDDIYEDTDKLVEDNLPDGYENYNDYLEDNIGYFNKNLSKAFAFIKTLFESLVDVTGQSYLILFCLSFGFAMYVLGRRLS